jgi:hypothetical protein
MGGNEIAPQPQRGPRNTRGGGDDRGPSNRGGRGPGFGGGGPGRERMARGGSKGPDGADSGASKFL